jgi:hypothetical protein
MSEPTMDALLFLPRPRHASWAGSCLHCAFFAERLFRHAREDIGDMRRLNSLLRTTRTRIGRRLAQIVAIAAASLPAAGA